VRLSLFTNVTLCPTEMDTDAGLTPEEVMVIVAPLAPVVPVLREMTVTEDGDEGELPPQHGKARLMTASPTRRAWARGLGSVGMRVSSVTVSLASEELA
jgi:hypothetical protein